VTQHPSPAALKKCPGERVFKKKSLDFHYKNIGEAGKQEKTGDKRLLSKLHQVSFSHPLSVSHTRTKK